jgi:hypothetical protein
VEVQVTVADFHGNGVPAVAGPAPAVVDAVIRAMPATIHLRRAMDDLHQDVVGIRDTVERCRPSNSETITPPAGELPLKAAASGSFRHRHGGRAARRRAELRGCPAPVSRQV